MLAIDLTLDPSVAIAADAADAKVYSVTSQDAGRVVRSRADVATTTPTTLTIGHTTRSLKGLRSVANSSVSGQDIVIDRHLVRHDRNVSQSLVLDPEAKINSLVQLVIEVPRLGASTPTAAAIAGELKRLVSMLTTSSNANLIRLLNNEA